MITTAEYNEYWGSQNLLHYDAALVDRLAISAESKRFLVKIGLPCDGNYYFPMDAKDPTLPYIESVCFDPEVVPSKYRHLRLLGTRCLSLTRPVHYGLSEEEGGTVYAIRDNSEGEIEIFFVSSSVQQYAELVLHLERWRKWQYKAYAACIDVDYMEAAEILVRTLREIDPLACEPETPSGLETELGAMICHIEYTGITG